MTHADIAPVLNAVFSSDDEALPFDEKFELMNNLDEGVREAAWMQVLQRFDASQTALREHRRIVAKQHRMIDELTQKPWYPATMRRFVTTVDGQCVALVSYAGEDRLVTTQGDAASAKTGDTVFLSAEQNAILGKAPESWISGQIGKVADVRSDGTVVVREHDRELTVEVAHWLDRDCISAGTTVVWCPRTRVVLEITEPTAIEGVDEIGVELTDPPPRFAGYEIMRTDVLDSFEYTLRDPAGAARYGLDAGRATLLLYGPPGCGKTLLARNLAHTVGARLFVINATSIFSPWVGESERHVIEAFKRARAHAPALLFIDEIDALGRVRGGTAQQHADRVGSVLLTQMDGARGAPGVGVIGACNRPDLLDSALRSRFSRQFRIPAPKRDAVREIAEVHLAETLPYVDDDARSRSIDILVHRLTSPNADNDVATIQFRDGKTRLVRAADLVSGRTIKQIAEQVCDVAFKRSVVGGEDGIRPGDVERVADDILGQWRETLCVENVRSFLTDLPDDVVVSSVQPVQSMGRASDYLAEAV